MEKILLSLLFVSQLAFTDASKLVKENCASCHEDEGLNLISLSSMTYLTQSELMYVLQKENETTSFTPINRRKRGYFRISCTK